MQQDSEARRHLDIFLLLPFSITDGFSKFPGFPLSDRQADARWSPCLTRIQTPSLPADNGRTLHYAAHNPVLTQVQLQSNLCCIISSVLLTGIRQGFDRGLTAKWEYNCSLQETQKEDGRFYNMEEGLSTDLLQGNFLLFLALPGC
jgi:hypothetical protein